MLMASSLIWTDFLSYGLNLPLLNQKWIFPKAQESILPDLSAVNTVYSRNIFARNQLNLGAWSGYQTVWLRDEIPWTHAEGSFRIPVGGYLDIFFDQNSVEQSGVRLTRRGDFFSISFLRQQPTGKFLERQEIGKLPVIGFRRWHHFKVALDSGAPTLEMDSATFPLPFNFPPAKTIGFSAGRAGANIDDVRLQKRDGSEFFESFAASELWPFLFWKVAIFHAVIFLVGLLRPQLVPQKLFLLLFAWGLFLLAADFSYWSQIEFRWQPVYRQDLQPFSWFESVRYRLFARILNQVAPRDLIPRELSSDEPDPSDTLTDQIKENILVNSAGIHRAREGELSPFPKKTPEETRIFIFGASMAYGLGARSIEETFAARLQRHLQDFLTRKNHRAQVAVWVHAALKQDKDNSQWVESLTEKIKLFEADLVLFSREDFRFDGFGMADGYNRLLSAIGTRSRTVAILKGPFNPKDRLGIAPASWVKPLVDKYRVEIIDPNPPFAPEIIDLRGNVWRDDRHLTSFGQDYLAENITAPIAALLGRKKDLPPNPSDSIR